MVNLEPEDRKQLIAVLKDIPELATERGRRLMLTQAGLEKLASSIDISGSAFLAVAETVQWLSRYGAVDENNEALGLFLKTIQEVDGVKPEQREYLEKMLNKYEMMTPIVTSFNIREWRSQKTAISDRQKTIGENTLRPIDFLAEGLKVARSVVYIGVRTVNGSMSATGFTVAPNLVLTVNRVLPYAEMVQNALFRFNYEENFLGEAKQIFEYKAKKDGIFHTNINLDYTLVEVEGEPGKKWGYLPLAAREVLVDTRVNIIQHLMGRPKEISMQNNFVQYVGGNVVQYITSTLPCSSGSPVFNDNWEVVALHHSGGNIPEPTTGERYYRKEGILISSILKDLPEELKEMLVD